MTEERRLMASGMPLEDAISICHDLRRERDELPKLVHQKEAERRLIWGEENEWILTV